MCLFTNKVNIIKEINPIVYRHLVNVHKVDVDTLYREFRCVKRKGVLGGLPQNNWNV